MTRNILLAFLLIAGCSIIIVHGQVFVRADGLTDTYKLINDALLERSGDVVEVPDCIHNRTHITQIYDLELDRFVFQFHAHAELDNDRCIRLDRSRTEIKTFNPSPEYLKGYLGETVSFSWNFKLEPGFQPSNSFTHLHQIKAVDGDDSMPTITLTALRGNNGNPNYMQLINVDSKAKTTRLNSTNLDLFFGEWIHVNTQLTYNTKGQYSITVTRIRDGAELLSFHKNNLDLWRNETSFSRPKWGIYRSLTNPNVIRDEIVKYDNFCLAKDPDYCV